MLSPPPAIILAYLSGEITVRRKHEITIHKSRNASNRIETDPLMDRFTIGMIAIAPVLLVEQTERHVVSWRTQSNQVGE